MAKLISVVIPSYNYEAYLPQAVQSVASQTYPDIELVIVDDYSTDGSRTVIEQLANQYGEQLSGMKVILNPHNMGAHAAINAGVANAEGELVTILNADDLYEAERLSVMAERMAGASLAFSAIKCIDAQGGLLGTEQAKRFEFIQKKLVGKRSAAFASLGENMAVSTGNMLFERSLFDKLGGFRNYKYVHDYDFFLRACLLAEPVFVPETAYLYRLHGENAFTKLAEEGVRENRMVWLDVYGEIKEGHVQNPVILENPDYIGEFKRAAEREGKKKLLLWRMAGNPLVGFGLDLMKKRYDVD